MDKVITAVFPEGGSNTVTVYGLWQWDYGISLQIMGLSLPETVEVHFSIGQGEPVKQEGNTTDGITTVNIPDSMLAGPTGAGFFGCMGAFLVNAWVYVEEGTSGRTVKMVKLSVKTRAKPPDYIATPEEKKTWEQLQEGKADKLELAGRILSLMSGERLLSEVTLPTGGGGEELADIRVGADGKIYASAGEAVRVQVGQLKSDIGQLSEEKVSKPTGDGTEGQVLARDADGNTVWRDVITELQDGTVTVPKLAPDVMELLNSSSGSGGDTLKGSLPYAVNESGLYIVANSDTSVTVSSDDSQLISFSDDNITISKSSNGSNIDTYNKVNLSVVSENCINIETQDASTNLCAYLNMPTGFLVPGEKYTIFGRIEKVVDTGKIYVSYLRFFEGTIQMNLSEEISCKSFVANDNGTWGRTYACFQRTDGTIAGDNYNVYLYLYQGELTEMPSENAILSIVAGEKYSTDGYLGKTLTGNDADIPVYVYKTNTDSVEVETDTDGVIFFGDSILDFSGVPALYAKKTGKPIIDCAVGGTRLSGSRDSSNEYYPYDMTNIADAIASGDFSAQINGGKNSQFSTLATATISNYKAIIMGFGTNDFTAKVPFHGTDITSIEGALKHILTTILTAYPNMRIVVLSTLQYVTVGSGNESGVPTHDDGTVWQMNEIIKSICESDDYCVPWVDMYHAMGQNGLTRGTLTSDGVHLMSPNGVKRYNDILVGQLNSLGI